MTTPFHYLSPLPAGLIVMLRGSSHLTNYIKKFKLELQSRMPLAAPMELMEEGAHGRLFGGFSGGAHMLAPLNPLDSPTEEDIPLVRNLLAGLTTLRLIATSDACPWYLSTCGLIKTLAQALAVTTTLETLDVTGVPDFPILLLKRCTSLQKLKVSRLVEEEDNADGEVARLVNYLSGTGVPVSSADRDIRCTPTFLHLGPLSSIHTLQLLRSPQGPVNSAHIRELSIQCDQCSDLQDHGIRGSDWPQLVSLCLRNENWYSFTQYNIDLSIRKPHQRPVPALAAFKALKTLTIFAPFHIWLVPCYSLIDSFTSPVCWIVDVLVGATQSRETVTTVVLNLEFKDFTNLEGMVLSKIDWSPLEWLHKSFSRLEKVVIHFRISTPEQEERLLYNKGLQKLQLQVFDFRFEQYRGFEDKS